MASPIIGFITNNRNLLIVVCIGSFSVFYNLSGKAINPWDESLTAVNALEMLKNHDWFNFYYAGSFDLWNAKPPLFVWLLCMSFTFFGKSIFALRIIPAVASLLILMVIYKTVEIFIDKNKALLCCLILCSCKGFFGGHTGRSGDYDALLTLFLLLSIYFFLRYFVNKQKNSFLYSCLFMGLAFFAKGPACFLFIPAFAFFLIINRHQLKNKLRKEVIYGALIFFAFPVIYFIIQIKFGITSSAANGITNTNSAPATLFIYDVFYRIFRNDTSAEHTWDAFIAYLDVYFFAWYILFYITIALFIFKKLKLDNPLILFSCLSVITISIFFTLMFHQKVWYLMPLIPFIAIMTSYGISFILKYNRLIIIPVIIIAIVSIAKQYSYLSDKNSEPPVIANNIAILKNAAKINCIGITQPDVICYLYFLNDNLNFAQNKSAAEELTIADKKSSGFNISNFRKIVYQDENYLVGELLIP